MATPRRSPLELAALFRAGVGTGSPPKFNKPEALVEKINEYFEAIEKENEPPTITGLTLFCGFCSRQSFYDYQNDKSEFSYVTRAARLVIAKWHEIRLCLDDEYQGGKTNYQGSIFMLKNFGFSDTQTIEHTGKAEVRQTFKIGKKVIEF
jgi:hypothetical protein